VVVTDIAEIKRLEEELRRLSFYDALTGLYNRTYFEQELKRLAHGRQRSVGLILGDVEMLKPVNDTLGHVAGDTLLKRVAEILADTVDPPLGQ
jgi:diguanylate cyclase (GGDEF)-like protein